MPAESREVGCCCKPDMKKEAQRTNRFNTNSSSNPTSSCLTPCNHLESTDGAINDYKSREKDDLPCINIILKPILDPKTDEKDKDVQIVEITAVTDDSNKYSINNTNTSFPDKYQSASKKTEKVDTTSVTVQTEIEKNMHDSSTQTTETPENLESNGVPLTRQTPPEAIMGNLTASQQVDDANLSKRYRGVQFKDDKTVADNITSLNDVFLPEANSSRNRDATSIINVDNSTTMEIIDDQYVRTTEQETSVSRAECCGSMGTLYNSVNSESKANKFSEFKGCVKKSGQGTQGKLSDRIKRDIDKLEIGNCTPTQSSAQTTNTRNETQQESVKTQTSILPCIDICKDIASQAEAFKNYSDTTSTLPSVVSINPPIPRISLDATETIEWKSPAKNESSKATIGTLVSDSSLFPSLNNTSCCLNHESRIKGRSCKTRNTTLDKNHSNNVSYEQQFPDNENITACRSMEKKSDETKKNVEKFDRGTGTRGFWTDGTADFSKLEIEGNSSARTESTKTVNAAKTSESTGGLPLINDNKLMTEDTLNARKCCKSIAVQTNSVSFSTTPEYSTAANTKLGDRPHFMLSKPNTRNFLTASDLTRPEFIRMLTELKEHTCSLELQLAAMNDAMKRKQASRNRVFSSTLKNYEPMRQDHLPYKTQNKKIKTTNESSGGANDFSSIEYARQTPKGFNVENSIDTSCCASPNNNSLSDNRHPASETLIDETCCGSTITSESNKSYTPLNSCGKPEEIITAQNGSNISISKWRPKKPAFKAKKNYLGAPVRSSDHRIRKQKEDKPTPSGKSMIVPQILSQSLSKSSFMVKSKIDVSCSPTNCCNEHDDSLQTMFKAGGLSPSRKLEECDVTVRSATHSTTSNPSVNRMIVRPVFLSSTLKRPTKTVTESEKISFCDSDTSKYSNGGKGCSQSTKMEPVLGTEKQNLEDTVQTSQVKSKIPKVRPRLVIKQSSSKFRTKSRPKSIPSNSHLRLCASRESFHESCSNNSSKNPKTQQDATRPSLIQSKKLRVVPRLKLKSIHSRNPSHSKIEKNNSRAYLDPACCSRQNENDETISEVNMSSHSNRNQSAPDEKILAKLVEQNRGKDHFAYAIKTEQNTPFLVNNCGKYDSEEEVSSTDYEFNKSGNEYPGKESKDNVNGKKRKRNSKGEKFLKIEEKSDLSISNTPELRNRVNNSRNKNNSYSGKIQRSDNVLGKSNQTNSQKKDSKCTICVTVSLDNTPSREEVENI